MIEQFKNMNDLSDYLGKQEKRTAFLEQRLQSLEAENKQLRALSGSGGPVDQQTIARYVAIAIPKTDLIHPNFLRRAFAVWGHYFVAQLIISLVLMFFYCLFIVVMTGALQGMR